MEDRKIYPRRHKNPDFVLGAAVEPKLPSGEIRSSRRQLVVIRNFYSPIFHAAIDLAWRTFNPLPTSLPQSVLDRRYELACGNVKNMTKVKDSA